MKKTVKLMFLIAAMTMMFSVAAMAANQDHYFNYRANGVTYASPPNKKANDGDYKVYVTTFAGDRITPSDVFNENGTAWLYARSRLQDDPDQVYSPSITFNSNRKGSATYASGMAKFNRDYILRTEIDNCAFTSSVMHQWIRWCP